MHLENIIYLEKNIYIYIFYFHYIIILYIYFFLILKILIPTSTFIHTKDLIFLIGLMAFSSFLFDACQ